MLMLMAGLGCTSDDNNKKGNKRTNPQTSDSGDTGLPTTTTGTTGTTGTTTTTGNTPTPNADKRVFVTSSRYRATLGGASGGDVRCQSAADNAGLGGSWMAWLSEGTEGAPARLTDVGPWYNLNGDLVFQGLTSTHSPQNTMAVDEFGATALTTVWTGTDNDGYLSYNCGDWSTQDEYGMYGESNGGISWTNEKIDWCDVQRALYCFEQ